MILLNTPYETITNLSRRVPNLLTCLFIVFSMHGEMYVCSVDNTHHSYDVGNNSTPLKYLGPFYLTVYNIDFVLTTLKHNMKPICSIRSYLVRLYLPKDGIL